MTKNVNTGFESSKLALKKLAKDLLETSPEVQGKDQEYLLDFLAEQAVNGTDLQKTYPKAFQALLKDSSLRETFAELIDSIEQERAGELPDLPAMFDPYLDFLRESGGSRKVKQTGPSSWQVLFRRTAEELLNLYRPRELVYRSAEAKTDQDWLPLVREDIDLNAQTSIAFSLEISHTSNPNELGLFTSIALNPSALVANPEYLYGLQIKWGEYEGNIKMGEGYRVPLPHIQVATVEGNLSQDLAITLNIENPPKNED